MKARYTQDELLAFAKFMGVTADEADIARWQYQTAEGGEARVRHRVQAHREALERHAGYFSLNKNNNMGDELFTTTELTSFGTYLLSAERTRSILNSDMEGDPIRLLANVHHADFENWKALHGEAGVAISEGPSPQPEKPRTVVLVDTPLIL